MRTRRKRIAPSGASSGCGRPVRLPRTRRSVITGEFNGALQCTNPHGADDWHVGRFSLLAQELRTAGHDVVARDLSPDSRRVDPVLSRASRDDNDEIWLLGVDGRRTTALSPTDIAAVNAFHRAGGGLFTTRDHENGS